MAGKEPGAIRAFIAIELPKELKERLLFIQNEFELALVKFVSEEKMHITLFFLGNINPKQFEKVKEAIEKTEIKKFGIAIKGMDSFSRKDPHVLFAKIDEGKEEILQIYLSMLEDIKNAKINLENRPYLPHVTLARTSHPNKSDKIAIFSLIERNAQVLFGSFICSSIKIVESRPAGQSYEYIDLYTKRF